MLMTDFSFINKWEDPTLNSEKLRFSTLLLKKVDRQLWNQRNNTTIRLPKMTSKVNAVPTTWSSTNLRTAFSITCRSALMEMPPQIKMQDWISAKETKVWILQTRTKIIILKRLTWGIKLLWLEMASPISSAVSMNTRHKSMTKPKRKWHPKCFIRARWRRVIWQLERSWWWDSQRRWMFRQICF